jgi:hypothetical protein
MKERGKYQIQCMKSRSSTGVGQKIDLEYNIDTMRITDNGGDDAAASSGAKPSFMDAIKARSQVKAADVQDSTAPWEPAASTKGRYAQDTPSITADVQSAKLKQLLGKIKQS